MGLHDSKLVVSLKFFLNQYTVSKLVRTSVGLLKSEKNYTNFV